MRVLLAGATGAIGHPLLAALRAAGHEVLALTRKSTVQVPGTRVVVADVLNRDALLRAVDGISADVVIHELTALSKPPTKYADMEVTNTLRTTGTAHLLEAARAVGARRFLTQSMVPGYGYIDHGTRVLTEQDPFGQPRGSKEDPVVAAMHSNEQQAFTADGIEGIALRYGAFYGLTGSQGLIVALRAGKLPVPRDGGRIMSWIHLADAAAATMAAMDKGVAGQAYNIVDDEPGRTVLRRPHDRHHPAGVERQSQSRTGLDTHVPHLPRGYRHPSRLTAHGAVPGVATRRRVLAHIDAVNAEG